MHDFYAAASSGAPHLMEYLWDAFLADLREKAADRRARGLDAPPDAELAGAARAKHFVAWASRRLAENRPQDTFYSEANVGIKFDDMTVAVLCPRTASEERHAAAVRVNDPKNRAHEMGKGSVGI